MEPDETLAKISEFDEAVFPRSSLGRSFSCKRLLLIHFYLRPLPPTIGERKVLCQALRYTGKLGMADLMFVEITD